MSSPFSTVDQIALAVFLLSALLIAYNIVGYPALLPADRAQAAVRATGRDATRAMAFHRDHRSRLQRGALDRPQDREHARAALQGRAAHHLCLRRLHRPQRSPCAGSCRGTAGHRTARASREPGQDRCPQRGDRRRRGRRGHADRRLGDAAERCARAPSAPFRRPRRRDRLPRLRRRGAGQRRKRLLAAADAPEGDRGRHRRADRSTRRLLPVPPCPLGASAR